MSPTLFAKELKSSLFSLAVMYALIVAYLASVVAMFDPELMKSMDAMMDVAPELFAAFGMGTKSTTLVGFLINYLYGFLLELMPLILVLVLVNRLMVRYVDRGTMAYLLATPTSRVRIAATLAAVLVCSMAIFLVLVHVAELALSEALFPGELDFGAMARVNAGLFAVWVFMSAVCFLSTCVFSRAGLALWTGGAVCLAAYFLQMMSQLGDALEPCKYASFLTLFDAYGLATGEGSGPAVGVMVLGVAALVLFAVAVGVFARKDLNV